MYTKEIHGYPLYSKVLPNKIKIDFQLLNAGL